MSKVVVQAVGMSLDGFSAGADQSIDEPLGVLGRDLMAWFFPTKTFIEQHGGEGGETGIDDDFAALFLRICGSRFYRCLIQFLSVPHKFFLILLSLKETPK
ncbi:hypothetical protein BH20ACI2_BH20ACI2_15680 [soil metagenome]